MARVESTVTIARSIEEVYRFFLDLDTNVPSTDPNVESVVRTPDGPTRPGTTFHFRHKVLGRIRETTTTFVALDLNRQIEMAARVGPLRPKGSIAFSKSQLGTTVAVRLNPDPVGPLKLLSPIFARIGQRVWDQRLARIKHALELQADIERDTEKGNGYGS